MTNDKSNENATLDPTLEDLLNAACDETLTDEQFVAIASLMDQSDAPLADYYDYFLIHAELQQSSRVRRCIQSSLGVALRDEKSASASTQPTPRSKSLLDRASRNPVIPSIGVAMVVLVAFVLGLALTPMKEWIAGGEGRQPGGQADSEYVAILNGRKSVTWLEGTRPSLSDPRLAIGQRLVFAKGAIEVKYDTGVKVVIEGPAEFVVGGEGRNGNGKAESGGRDAANSGYLKLGSLVARVEGEKAQGFTIHTPSARIEDLGTEFGVEVNRSGAAEVVVLDGKVDVVREESPGVVAQRVQLTKDQGAFVASSSARITRRAKVDVSLVSAMRERLGRVFESSQAGVITPISAIASAEYNPPTQGVAAFLLGKGFTQKIPIETSTHGNTSWQHGSQGWFARSTVVQTVDFALGGTFTVAKAHIWNENGADSAAFWGVKDFTLRFSQDAVFGNGDDTTQSFSLEPASGLPTYTGEHFTLTPVAGVTNIRFEVDSVHPENNGFVGLAEVRFSTAAAPNSNAKETVQNKEAGATQSTVHETTIIDN